MFQKIMIDEYPLQSAGIFFFYPCKTRPLKSFLRRFICGDIYLPLFDIKIDLSRVFERNKGIRLVKAISVLGF
jgi:hypothetical protein